MDASKLFEGIALLIDLAERGEIDPWDVQVIEVIDRYLSELITAQEAAVGAFEADLSQSGQAFLSASMLVLFKANTLASLESPPDDLDPSQEDFPQEAEDGGGVKLRLPLERQLSRRPAALPPQKRRVTLKELIDQLQLMATQLQQHKAMAPELKTTPTHRLGSQSRAQAARAIAQLAHQENLTEVAVQLEQFLHHVHLILAPEQDWLNLDQLVELWTQASAASSTQNGNKAPSGSDGFLPSQHKDRVSVFWALLLLSAQSKVELAQEEFYQEIKIRTPEVKSVSARLELTDIRYQ
jgi:segregation and condensation protein A